MALQTYRCSKSLHPLHKSSVTFATIPYILNVDFESIGRCHKSGNALGNVFWRVRFAYVFFNSLRNSMHAITFALSPHQIVFFFGKEINLAIMHY